jgi:hypothetical protein
MHLVLQHHPPATILLHNLPATTLPLQHQLTISILNLHSHKFEFISSLSCTLLTNPVELHTPTITSLPTRTIRTLRPSNPPFHSRYIHGASTNYTSKIQTTHPQLSCSNIQRPLHPSFRTALRNLRQLLLQFATKRKCFLVIYIYSPFFIHGFSDVAR